MSSGRNRERLAHTWQGIALAGTAEKLMPLISRSTKPPAPAAWRRREAGAH
jgi:hypothetical protein